MEDESVPGSRKCDRRSLPELGPIECFCEGLEVLVVASLTKFVSNLVV